MNQQAPTFKADRSHRVLALVAAASLSLLLAACGGGKSGQGSEPAAKVNKGEVTVEQINFVLAAQRVKPEHAEAAGRQVLERLIDQEIVVQKAAELKLDADPKVLQQIEVARRDILTRAYAERVSQAAVKPTEAEIAQYYADKPALFKDRRVFMLQELNIEAKPEQVADLRARLTAANTLAEFADGLRRNDYRFTASQSVRPAEQVPQSLLSELIKLKDGQSLVIPAAGGLQVLYLQGSRSQPVDETRARPVIEQLLLNQRRAELTEKEMKALRQAAKVEYVGKFADKAAGAASAAADAAPLLAPAASDTAK